MMMLMNAAMCVLTSCVFGAATVEDEAVASGGATKPTVMIEVRLVQVGADSRVEMIEPAAEEGPSAGMRPKRIGVAHPGGPVGVDSLIVDERAQLKIGGRSFGLDEVLKATAPAEAGGSNATDGDKVQPARTDKAAHADESAGDSDTSSASSERRPSTEAQSGVDPFLSERVTVLAAPRVLTSVGQKAEIVMGAEVPYLAMRSDGLLELRREAEAYEGVSIEITPADAVEAFVMLDKLRIRVSLVASRQAIDGVPFDVGAPVMQTLEVSTAIRIAAGRAVVLALPRINDRAPLILAVVQARLHEAPGE